MKATLPTFLFCFFWSVVFSQTTPIPTPDSVKQLQEVVISASRSAEMLLSSPVTISKLDTKQIIQPPAPSFYEAIGNMKGVYAISPSLGFRVYNTRGFSNTTNVRFVQLIDGIDNQTPHIGAPMANALAPSDLDVQNIELVQGVASALYGMNATNGLINISTKNPFENEGFGFSQQVGMNHLSDNISARLFNETNLRWAKKVNDKWAFKLNLGYMKGHDWQAANRSDINSTANQTLGLLGNDNPAYDEVNGYGNESSNRKTLTLGSKNYVVARTGYHEIDVVDYRLQNQKGDVAIYFRPNAHTQLSYTAKGAFLENVYQRSNRFRLNNYRLSQHVLQFKNNLWQLKVYLTSENTGKSYNLRSMAENIDRNFKTDDRWFADYTKAYTEASKTDNTISNLHVLARQAADKGRPQPNTALFEHKIDSLSQINNWDIGAALRVRAHLAHAESIFDMSKALKIKSKIQTGVDVRQYSIVPDGNYFINPTDSNHNLTFGKYGVFLHATDDFFNNKLQLSLALRADKTQYFDMKFSQRLTAVYSASASDLVRFSYQNGYRFPSIFEGFTNINSGGVKRVGGLKIMSNGIFENSWLKSSIDAFQAAVNKDINTLGIAQNAAIEKNMALLQRNTYTYLQPEFMHSFEVGYRSMIQKRLFIDLDAYYNIYSNFIAQVEASIPNTTDERQFPAYLYVRTKQSRYRLWTNSKTTVYNYGAGLDMKYDLNKNYTLNSNLTFASLKQTEQSDGLEDGFNTPAVIANLSLSGRDIYQKIGYNLTAKYQSQYYWQSFLVNGDVPSIFNVDAQLNYRLKNLSSNIKIGATNLFNNYYYSYLGGPQVGGFYYVTLVYGQ